ncbi:MAG: hypothetical protein AAFY46_06885 [Planctomycetota bacterium]
MGLRSLLLLTVLLSSCAVYRIDPRRPTAEVQPLSPLPVDERLPGITLEVDAYNDNYRLSSPSRAQSRFLMFLRAVCEGVDVGDPKPGRLHVDVAMRTTTRGPGIRGAWGLISALTLGIIPFRDRQDTVVDVRLERDGQLLRQERFEESQAFWLSVFVLPASFSRSEGTVLDEHFDAFALDIVEMVKTQQLDDPVWTPVQH